MSWFSSGIADVIGDVAKEWIETDKESAEAKAIMVKTLDPSGAMRRDITKKTSWLYILYITAMVVLLFMVSFGWGDAEGAKLAMSAMKELFLPITGAWTAIVSASFGVNYSNVKQGS